MRLEHCPTKEMWADYFTKPIQGSLFYKLRDAVMNVDSSSEYHSSHRSVLRGECEPVECEQGEENLTSLLKEEMVADPPSPHSL